MPTTPTLVEHAAERQEFTQRQHDLLAKLRGWFRTDFALFDGATGEPLQRNSLYVGYDPWFCSQLCRTGRLRGGAELIADEVPLAVLAIPSTIGNRRTVAIGTFVTSHDADDEQLARAASKLELSPQDTARWIREAPLWNVETLAGTGQLAYERLSMEDQLAGAQREIRDVSQHLSTSYEEISLLYRLTQNLKLTSSTEELATLTLEWLAEVLPVEGLAIQLTHPPQSEAIDSAAANAPALLTYGDCGLPQQELTALIEKLGPSASGRPLIVNRPATAAADWPWPSVRELVIVPLTEGGNCFGWLVALNHSRQAEFGTVEASLLNSVAAILGIHNGNAELYHQQREIFAGVVRALTSAIDAKDPYTCGHSDRVARVAVRLAQQLGCDKTQTDTIYLAGLLHDVGKIGIDDNVLRKPGKLTDAEYEHIKTHTEIGYRILVGIKRLDDVLPIVLHHHEQWDGRGYPHGLAGEGIPFLARIAAVADAFDAMGSDRPYRAGMSDDKLDAILRDGAGKQWDATVVEAFFQARSDVREIVRGKQQQVCTAAPLWS